MYTPQEKCIPLKVQSQECLQSEEETQWLWVLPHSHFSDHQHVIICRKIRTLHVCFVWTNSHFFDWLHTHLLVSVVQITNSRLILFMQKGFKDDSQNSSRSYVEPGCCSFWSFCSIIIRNHNGMHKQLALHLHLVVDLCLYYACRSTCINTRTYVLSLYLR